MSDEAFNVTAFCESAADDSSSAVCAVSDELSSLSEGLASTKSGINTFFLLFGVRAAVLWSLRQDLTKFCFHSLLVCQCREPWSSLCRLGSPCCVQDLCDVRFEVSSVALLDTSLTNLSFCREKRNEHYVEKHP